MFKYRKIAITILKVIIVVAAWIYVGFKIHDFKNSFSSFKAISFTVYQLYEIALVFLLMLLNWSIESIK